MKTFLTDSSRCGDCGRTVRILLAVAAAFSVLTTLAFANNLVAIVRWWRAFLAAGGDSSAFPARANGFIPWLDWSAVDYSAVTTFIPALGCVSLTCALVRMARGRRAPVADFPFFRGSDQLNVALGLFGTLWGIIVIGYYRLDTVSMADLMQCLHTALFSTLTAVVWVFMIDRPLLRPWFVRLLTRADLAETEDGDLAATVDRLVERLGAASDAFDAREKAANAAFAKRMAEYERAFAQRESERAQAFDARERKCAQAFEARLVAYEEASERRRVACESAFESRRKAADEAAAKFLSGMESAAAARELAHERAFEQRLAEYQKAFDAREKEYVEFFTRRIAELESAAAGERERADRLAAKLAAVSAALK